MSQFMLKEDSVASRSTIMNGQGYVAQESQLSNWNKASASSIETQAVQQNGEEPSKKEAEKV